MDDPHRRFRRCVRPRGPVGTGVATPGAPVAARAALGQQPRHRAAQHRDRAPAVPHGRGGHGRLERREGLGPAEQLRRAVLARGATGRGGDGLRDLAAARDGARRARALAPAPGAPRRPGLRPDHGHALPPAGDRALHGHQVRHHRAAGRAGAGGGGL